MSEFNLANAVSVFSTYAGADLSLWGLYVAAGFTAGGFGASMGDQFTTPAAIFLIAGYAAFAAAHLKGVLNNLSVRETMAAEIAGRLAAAHGPVTEFPATVAAATMIPFGRRFTYVLHGVVDFCVIAVIVTTALTPDLNSAGVNPM